MQHLQKGRMVQRACMHVACMHHACIHRGRMHHACMRPEQISSTRDIHHQTEQLPGTIRKSSLVVWQKRGRSTQMHPSGSKTVYPEKLNSPAACVCAHQEGGLYFMCAQVVNARGGLKAQQRLSSHLKQCRPKRKAQTCPISEPVHVHCCWPRDRKHHLRAHVHKCMSVAFKAS